MADIQLYDATLRDGMGGGGMSLTAEEKLRVVQALVALGVHMIEAGFPASNPKEQRLFELLAEQDLHAAQVVAFGMTRRRDLDADGDPGLRVLAECFAPVCTLVGKTSVLHVEKVVRASREENLRMIADSIAFLVRAGKRVLFDAEHFFDGLELDAGYALDCLRAARDAGAERLVLAPDPAQPYVGKHAFAHKAGMHAAGVRADAHTFEHVDPAVVGNSRDVLISELSGKGAIVEKAGDAGIKLSADASDAFARRVVERVKELEHEGFQFEAADGSLELLMRKEAGEYEPLFRLESWRVLVEKRADGKVETEGTIKIWLGGERFVRTAEGNGPVNALDKALREAIGEIHPHLRDISLVNFKVRILDESKGTGAVTRVMIDASDGREVWGSLGVSENVIAASWDALVDSLEYGMQPG